jgi:octopine/nopaline transport system permease protein/arginine/ornithine transport system permease protein
MNLDPILDNLPRYASGAWLTLEITALSVAIGLACAVPLALMRVSRNPALWLPVYGFIFYFRGTPFLVQLFLVYYGSGQFRPELEALGLWTFFREPYFCAVFTLVLNTAAYTAEILRGAIRAVPFGEVEAARACGMSGALLYRRIILPKAFRIALPAYSNEVVFLFQTTALVSIITLMDLTGVARVIISRSFATFEVWIFVGLMYLLISYAILYVFKKVEYRLMGHLRERPGAKPGVAPAVVGRPAPAAPALELR